MLFRSECQFEGVLHGFEPYVSLIGGVVGDVCERIKYKDSILIEDCCVKAKIFDGDFAGGILRGSAVVSRCFFCGEIHSSESAGGIQTDGERYIMNNCVCAATEISCKKRSSIAQPWDREQMAFDDWGVLLGTGVIDHGWMNFAGRIQTDDFTLEPQEEFMNYCTASCKLLTGTGEHPAIEGSLRDGVTISDEQARDPDFYRSIGWDFDTVWEMGEDGYPQIISP